MAVQLTRTRPITTPATSHLTLDALNAQLRQAVLATATPTTTPETMQTYCPHCCRQRRKQPPVGAFRRECKQHMGCDPACPQCGQHRKPKGCTFCGDSGFVFWTDADCAASMFDIAYPASTTSPNWLLDALTDESACWIEGEGSDGPGCPCGWEDMERRLFYLIRPGAPWHRQKWAERALLVFIRHRAAMGQTVIDNVYPDEVDLVVPKDYLARIRGS